MLIKIELNKCSNLRDQTRLLQKMIFFLNRMDHTAHIVDKILYMALWEERLIRINYDYPNLRRENLGINSTITELRPLN